MSSENKAGKPDLQGRRSGGCRFRSVFLLFTKLSHLALMILEDLALPGCWRLYTALLKGNMCSLLSPAESQRCPYLGR